VKQKSLSIRQGDKPDEWRALLLRRKHLATEFTESIENRGLLYKAGKDICQRECKVLCWLALLPGFRQKVATTLAKNSKSELGENLRHTLRALRGRNYAMFFVGQGLSLIGTWMQGTAMGLLIWQMTGRPQDLGMVGFFGTIFGFLISPFAGVLSDRWPRRRVMLVTQTLAMCQAIVLSVLTMTGTIQIWHIMVLAGFMSLVMAFDIPARQAFVVQMVDRKEDLPNAIALNSFMFNGARLVGPLAAGLFVTLGNRTINLPFAGEGLCFASNAVSFLAVIASLLAMKLKPYQRSKSRDDVLTSFKEGFRYVHEFRVIRSILVMLAVTSFLSMPYNTLMPAMDSKVIHHCFEVPQRTVPGVGPKANVPEAAVSLLGHKMLLPYERTFSMFLACIATGAIGGALYLASRKNVLGLMRMIPVASMTLGAGMIGFALSTNLWLSMTFLLFTGFGFIVQMASSNTLLQTIVDEDKRGRVMSFYTMAFQGTAPFAALLAGWLAFAFGQAHGEQITIGMAGVVLVTSGIVFLSRIPSLNALVRPVYVRLGIIAAENPGREGV
jgi:MFS family permease